MEEEGPPHPPQSESPFLPQTRTERSEILTRLLSRPEFTLETGLLHHPPRDVGETRAHPFPVSPTQAGCPKEQGGRLEDRLKRLMKVIPMVLTYFLDHVMEWCHLAYLWFLCFMRA